MVLAIVDTGPLVAFFDRAERHHRWAIEQIEAMEPPLLVCEPVLAEAMYLLGAQTKARDTLLGLLENGALEVAFQIPQHVDILRQLMHRYRDTPMSLADACLVRMAELHTRHAVMTLDTDFLVYRKNGRTPLDLIHPDSQPS